MEKKISEWKAIEKVATSRYDEFERKLGYCSDHLKHALNMWAKLWDEFPEYRKEKRHLLDQLAIIKAVLEGF